MSHTSMYFESPGNLWDDKRPGQMTCLFCARKTISQEDKKQNIAIS